MRNTVNAITLFAAILLAQDTTHNAKELPRDIGDCAWKNYKECVVDSSQNDEIDFASCRRGDATSLDNWIICPEGPVSTILYDDMQGDTIPVAVIESRKLIWINDRAEELPRLKGSGSVFKIGFVDDVNDAAALIEVDSTGTIIGTEFE